MISILLKSPYTLAAATAKLAFSRGFSQNKCQVWARNSYALGTLRPLVSDLDLTALFERALDEKDLIRLRETYRYLKIAFPFLGEMNVYEKGSLDFIARVINPFELDRDPKLKAWVKPRALLGETRDGSAAAFFLRMLESDSRNLRTRPKDRMRKWQSHISAVGSAISGRPGGADGDGEEISILTDPFRALLSRVVYLLKIGDHGRREEVLNALEFYFACVAAGIPRDKLSFLSEKHPWLTFFLPHRFCVFEPEPAEMDAYSLSLFTAQVEWELFGMSTQLPLAADRAPFLTHLKNLKSLTWKVAEKNPGSEMAGLMETFGSFEKRVDRAASR